MERRRFDWLMRHSDRQLVPFVGQLFRSFLAVDDLVDCEDDFHHQVFEVRIFRIEEIVDEHRDVISRRRIAAQ